MSGGPEDSTPQFPGAEYLKASQTCREGGDSLPPNNQWNVLGALEFLSGKNFHGEPIGFAIIAKLAALRSRRTLPKDILLSGPTQQVVSPERH